MQVSQLLCEACQELLEMVDHQLRCRYCFSSSQVKKWKVCSECLKQTQYLTAFGSVFDDSGPAFDLIRQLKTSRPYLSESLAAYLVIQWDQFNWPKPDIVVPVAGTMSRWFQRGYHPGTLLAKNFSSLIDCRFQNVLRRISYQTEAPHFHLRKSVDLRDKVVLLIDDCYHTGATIRAAAEALLEGAPLELYALTVTRKLE